MEIINETMGTAVLWISDGENLETIHMMDNDPTLVVSEAHDILIRDGMAYMSIFGSKEISPGVVINTLYVGEYDIRTGTKRIIDLGNGDGSSNVSGMVADDNGNIYLAGTCNDRATVWEYDGNNTVTQHTMATGTGSAISIGISGGDLIVYGVLNEKTAIWKCDLADISVREEAVTTDRIYSAWNNKVYGNHAYMAGPVENMTGAYLMTFDIDAMTQDALVQLDAGPNSISHGIVEHGDDIYISGSINPTGERNSATLWKYDGSSAISIPLESIGNSVTICLYVHGDNIYASGYETIDDTPFSCVWKYNITTGETTIIEQIDGISIIWSVTADM